MSNQIFHEYEVKFDVAKANLKRIQDRITADQVTLDLYIQGVSLCDLCLKEMSQMKTYIEDIVSLVIQTTFDNDEFKDWTFEYQSTYKPDGVTLAGIEPVVVKSDGTKVNPTEGEFEGLNNAISVGQRLAFIFINPDLSKVCIMDEYLKHIAVDRQQKLIDTVIDLHANNVEIQCVAITHSSVLGGKNYHVTNRGGVSKVKEKI